MLVDSGNFVIIILSFNSLLIIGRLYSVGHWNPYRLCTGPEFGQTGIPLFQLRRQDLLHPRKPKIWNVKMHPWKKNENIYKPWFLAFKVNFAGMSTFCSPAFLMPFRYTISLCFWTEAYGRCCLWTRRTQRSVTLRITFSLWEQGLYHLVAGAVLQLPCEHMWTRNKSLYPVRFYFLDSDMVDWFALEIWHAHFGNTNFRNCSNCWLPCGSWDHVFNQRWNSSHFT